MARIVETTNESVIAAYEGKFADLEHTRLRLQQQAANYTAPTGTFEEKLEPALQFLANPWKLWQTGQIALQRAVLRLTFTERLAYHQNEGARTRQLALPFKVLESFQTGKSDLVHLEGITSNTIDDDLFDTLEDWNTYLKAENVDFDKLPTEPKRQVKRKLQHRQGPSL